MSEALFNERVVVCPKCEGDGKVVRSYLRLGIVTIRPISRTETCPTCHGDGYVLRKDGAA